MKLNKFIFLPFLFSILSFLVFALTPATLDEQGFLQEPFYLILLGYAFLFFGLVLLVIQFFKQS